MNQWQISQHYSQHNENCNSTDDTLIDGTCYTTIQNKWYNGTFHKSTHNTWINGTFYNTIHNIWFNGIFTSLPKTWVKDIFWNSIFHVRDPTTLFNYNIHQTWLSDMFYKVWNGTFQPLAFLPLASFLCVPATGGRQLQQPGGVLH